MGETPSSTEREIEHLRDEISGAVAELERRARTAIDPREQARQHPRIVGAAAAGVLGLGAFVVMQLVERSREQRKPINRIRRRADEVVGDLEDRFRSGRARLESKVLGEDGMSQPRQDPGMVKSLLWMALTAGFVALFGLLARRASSAVWQAVMNEPPPTAKV